MNKQKVVEEVFETAANVAPHIASGIQNRREYSGNENESGEEQFEADIWANEFFKEEITSIDGVGEFASEEEEDIIDCGEGLSVTIDPLDGSSNIPSNNLIGTIIGIYDKDLPCSGKNLVSAFYIVYGPLLTLTKAENGKVNEYVIEEDEGDGVEIVLANEDIVLPDPKVYGFGGNKHWTDDFREFAEEISKELKLRYGGAFVGDINQTLHYGGLFGYPHRTDAPNGKYRLMFESNPVAYIIEAAGGSSTNAEKSILEIKPEKLHERCPFFAGNPELIDRVEEELNPDL